MDNPSHVLETAPVAGKRLRCRFTRQDGQFAHEIELVGEAQAIPLLVSHSATAGDWPASPPYQELHVETMVDNARIPMLVGRAGKSHWSMSVTVDASTNALLFDVACRVRERPEFLGTTYQRAESAGLQITAVELEGEAVPVVRETQQRLVIDATRDVDPPATVRWAYRIGSSMTHRT